MLHKPTQKKRGCPGPMKWHPASGKEWVFMFGTENTTLLEIALYLRLCRAKIQSVQLTFTVNNAPPWTWRKGAVSLFTSENTITPPLLASPCSTEVIIKPEDAHTVKLAEENPRTLGHQWQELQATIRIRVYRTRADGKHFCTVGNNKHLVVK